MLRSKVYLPNAPNQQPNPPQPNPERKGKKKLHEIAAVHLTDGGALASACLERGDGGEDEGEGQEAAERHDDRERDGAPVPSPSPSTAAPGGPVRRRRRWGRLRRDAHLHGVDDAIAAGDGDAAHARRDPQLHPPPPPPPPTGAPSPAA